VVFSDDMEMKAISDHCEPGEAAALALRAGVDVMLFCHDLEKAVDALESLYSEAEREPALRAQIHASYQRIGALKECYLKEFTSVAEDELVGRLEKLNHRRLIEEIHGSL
jgi:beta-N-acetylhexosaminidase